MAYLSISLVNILKALSLLVALSICSGQIQNPQQINTRSNNILSSYKNTDGNQINNQNQYNPYSTNQNDQNVNNKNYKYSTSYGGNNVLNSNYDSIDLNLYCPEYWIAYRQTCYRFVKSPRRNWYDAKKICQAYNANIVNVDNVDKHGFLIKELILQNQQQNRYYVSTREVSKGSWLNDDGSSIPSEIGRVKEDSQFEKDHYDAHDPDSNLSKDKDRLVYGYSTYDNRWGLIPTRNLEPNLFICESQQLYNANNYNIYTDDKRGYDYGYDVIDIEKIPRGPYFIKQPKNTIFDINRRKNEVTMQCLAGGYPTPTYKWFKEEYLNDSLTFTRIDPLKNSRYTLSGGNLIITDPKQSIDQGRHHCVAENKFGRILSESINFNFGFIMEFNLKRSAEYGEMTWGKSIFCDPPQHYPSGDFYWSRDYFPNFVDEDQRVFVSYDGSLYFSALEAVDRGSYSCTVKTSQSDTGRNGPFFPLNVRPSQAFQDLIMANTFPKVFPEAPIAGQDIRLECMAFGYPIPHYNWTRRDGALPRNSQIINYNRVLVIRNATINDNGDYICTAKNDRKSIQKSISLNIQMIPQFTISLRDRIKDYNGEVSFTCEAFSVPDSNYTWYKNAEKLDRESLDRDKYIIQDNVLTIKYLDPYKDDGMYQCRAENQLHGVYSSAQLRVLGMKPSFKKQPLESEIYATYNGNTTIACNPEAAPRPKITWKRNGDVIGPGGHRRILPSGTLVISPTSRDDEGVYTCVAVNSYGSDESEARLIVLQELRFIAALRQRIITQIGGYLSLRCDVVYDEILDIAFLWRFNGLRLNDEEDERITIDYNTIEIRNVSLHDTGSYECIAKSAVNQITSQAMVIVQGPPGAPGGVKVYDVKKTSAVIDWIDGTDNGRTIESYTIFARTNWNKTWVTVAESIRPVYDRASKRQRFTVENLNPWSGYEFSVAAVNDLGVGLASAPSPLFNTLNDRPYIAPRNLGGGGGKIGDLSIRWTPLKSEEQHSKGIYYKVFWRLYRNETEWQKKEIKSTDGSNPNSAVVRVPTDNYYTQYEVKIQAFNDVDSGPESSPVVIYSAEGMPQVQPQLPVAVGYNSTALNVSWEAVDLRRELIRGKLIGHRLKYWKKDHNEEDAVYYLSRKTRNWALIVGLEPDTYYFVKVMAFNSAGEGPESERYLERTYRKAPQKPPSAVHVFGVNPSMVRVVWRYISPEIDEEPVSGYKVRVWEADQDMATANDTFVQLGQKLECYVDNLTPGKTYKLRVLAYSNGGDGRMSSPTHTFQMGVTQARNSIENNRIDRSLLGVCILLSVIQLSTYKTDDA